MSSSITVVIADGLCFTREGVVILSPHGKLEMHMKNKVMQGNEELLKCDRVNNVSFI